MSDAAYSRRVDAYLAAGMDLDSAIACASQEDAHYQDPFLVMKQKAIDEGKML